jgi:hypothetical protein
MELSLEEIIMYSAVAIGVIIVGLFLYRKEIRFYFKKQEVNGTIVNWMSANEKGKRYFYPMIEFNAASGDKVTFRADERCEDKPLYAPGTEVVIQYLPTDVEFRKVIYPSQS